MNRHGETIRGFCIALAGLWLAQLYLPAHAREVVGPSAVQKATSDPAVIEQARRLNDLADRSATEELTRALEQLPRVAAKGTIAHEWLLDRGLHQLARVKPTPAARALVDQIAQQSPQIFVRVDPDHAEHAVPLYDPAATARFVLGAWERTAAREKASAALAAHQSWPIERFAQNDAAAESDPTKAGIVDAFRTADPEVLIQHRGALVAAVQNGERVDELAAVVAERLRDSDLYSLILSHADPIIALDALRRTREIFTDSIALDALIVASRRPEIASAALLEIGRSASQDSRARAYLFEMLRDASTGPSAATALALLHDADVVAELGRQLRTNVPETMRRHLALALRLEDSPAARGQLAQFLKTNAGSPKLRKEVGAWLAQ
ncbi:MAG: hypothetical protein ACREV5_01870 [Steroidobacter sp.]